MIFGAVALNWVDVYKRQGYNKDSYIFCDPWKKENYTYYKKDKVVTAYKGEYSQAVIITKR